AVDVPWDAGPFTSSAVSKYVFGLAPDTVYYAQAYLNTNFVGGIVYSPVVSFKTPAHTVIDLSETDTDGTGYTVSGSSPNQTLTINSSAGSPYTIIQSGGNDPSTSIFQNIVVNGGLTVTIMIREINVRCETDDVPVFSVKASASATTALELLLDGDNTLTQSATGAGNNAALSVSRPNELNMDNAAVLTIDTADGGGGSLTAKGGAGGAGIGGGDSGLSGKININGGNITAVGGAGTNGGAGIGGNGGSGAGINGGGAVSLALASAASVKAYSYTSDYPAIQAPGNSGDGYYVNAYFGAGEEPSVLTGAATRLNVYTENDQINAANTLELPNTYRSFAYTTNKTVEQSDSMWAIDTASSVPLGFVTRYDNGSPLIGSVKNPGTLQRVKLNSVAGSPSVMNIQKDGAANRADFTSTGHALPYGATLSEGGFRYSNSKNSETGALTGDISTKLWAEQTAASPKTETVEGLEPNTRYHMATYLNIDIFGGTQNFTSGSIPFATLPYIESASSAADEDDDTAALISADFYESTATNIAIDSVTLYWDTSPIDAGSPETAAHSEALTPGAYSDAGFTNYRLEGLSAETVYNLLLVIENESGADSRAFTHAPFEINVSVPVKLIFAAFDTDAGDITAPVYHIKNNGKNTASVTVDGFDEIDGDELTLTKDPPGANGLQLKLEGTGASLGTGMTDYLEISSSINEPLCTLQGFGEADDTYYFTFSGKYNGAFSTVRRPEYFLVLKFGLSQP
ncbi:MAG: hypothetical protein LBK23_00605, partial [Oscillospiraceae bacterium]|nr:hypothetical protein [Oscillospiraceae bacterium]